MRLVVIAATVIGESDHQTQSIHESNKGLGSMPARPAGIPAITSAWGRSFPLVAVPAAGLLVSWRGWRLGLHGCRGTVSPVTHWRRVAILTPTVVGLVRGLRVHAAEVSDEHERVAGDVRTLGWTGL